MPERTSEPELVEAINSAPFLRSKFELRSGYLTERTAESESPVLSTELGSRRRAKTNLSYAERFAPLLGREVMQVVAVSGSTSYRSASRSSDLDLFCIASRGTMWLSLAKSLLLARAFRLANPESPQICFSCIMDESFAVSLFSEKRDSLFARDALVTLVLKGERTYHDLLGRARWISLYYPALYSSKLESGNGLRGTAAQPSWATAVLDRFLHITVGAYIKVKSNLLNRKLAKQRRQDDAFDLRMGLDHLIVESNRYTRLRRAYATLKASPGVQ
ncbi:MAG: hypothetical protein LYZ69_06675 [Nitrososphaerales archaeon]|nr:hypothetical protein [Nitrososphaerales archaeon]